MAVKSIIIVISLIGLLCYGMPENERTQAFCGVGFAEARDSDTVAQRLIRDLEEALKSGDEERIRLARQRVDSHQRASQILKQRPALQRQLKAAIRPVPSRPLESQAALRTSPPKETLTKQTGTLKSPAGLSNASGLQGTAGGILFPFAGGAPFAGLSGDHRSRPRRNRCDRSP